MSDWADDLDEDDYRDAGAARGGPAGLTLRITQVGRQKRTMIILAGAREALMPFGPHLRCRPQWHRVGAVLRLVPDASARFQWSKSPLAKQAERWLLRFSPTREMDDDVYTRDQRTEPEWKIRGGALLVKVPDLFLMESKGGRP